MTPKSQASPPSSKAEEAFNVFCKLRALNGVKTNLDRVLANTPIPSRRRLFTKKRRKVRKHYMTDKGYRFANPMHVNSDERFRTDQQFRRLYDNMSVDERQEFYELVQKELK